MKPQSSDLADANVTKSLVKTSPSFSCGPPVDISRVEETCPFNMQ